MHSVFINKYKHVKFQNRIQYLYNIYIEYTIIIIIIIIIYYYFCTINKIANVNTWNVEMYSIVLLKLWSFQCSAFSTFDLWSYYIN